MQDCRYALRMMRRAPGFTAVAILSLALGIGANTAIFSLINTLMLRPLPVRNPGELVQFLSQYPDPAEPPSNSYAWKYYERFRDETHAFSDLIGVSPARFHLRADGIDADAVDGEYVVGNYFTMLGLTPAIGRLIGPQDDALGSGSAAVAVLSWASWTNRFHADPSVVGKRLVVDGAPATVIGVAPRRFFGLQVGAAPEIWLPVAMEPLIQRPSRRASGELTMSVMARIKPGVPRGQARAELSVINRDRNEEIAKRGDARWRQVTIDAVPSAAGMSRLTFVYARPLFALMAIVGLLLLLACTSVATLLLARGAARQREMTVRVALGAGRLRLVRQVLTESLLLAAAGCLLGIVLAYFGADALMRVVTSGRMPGMSSHIEIQPQLDLRVLLFTVGVSLATGVLFGLAPALSAWHPAPAASLRATGAAPDTPSRRFIGKGLVIAQVALSIVLLAAAGLFVRHMLTLRNVGLGFQRESVLLVTLDPAGSGYQGNQLAPIYRQLLERLAAIPGVRSATLSAVTPVSGAGASRFIEVPGFSEKAEDRRRVALNWTAPKYFETLGTPLLAGRDFTFEDQGRPPVAIVSQSMARYYFGDRSPIGQLFTFERQDNRGAARDQPYQIVGVVGDTKYLNLQEPIPADGLPERVPGAGGPAAVFAADERAAGGGRRRRAPRRSRGAADRHRRQGDDDDGPGGRVDDSRTPDRDAVRFLRRARGAARRHRALRSARVHRRAPHQRDRHPHGARRDAARRAGDGAQKRTRDGRCRRGGRCPAGVRGAARRGDLRRQHVRRLRRCRSPLAAAAAIAVALRRRVRPGAASIARQSDRGAATGVAARTGSC